MQIHVLNKSSAIDITRKYEKLCSVAFNRKFEYDDVIKMKNVLQMFGSRMFKLQHIKILEKIDHWWAR